MDCAFIETQKGGRALLSGGYQLERELKDGTFGDVVSGHVLARDYIQLLGTS